MISSLTFHHERKRINDQWIYDRNKRINFLAWIESIEEAQFLWQQIFEADIFYFQWQYIVRGDDRVKQIVFGKQLDLTIYFERSKMLTFEDRLRIYRQYCE